MRATLNALHHQGADWTRELDFYQEELAILSKRLEEVTGKNSDKETLAQVEHFQNRFIMFREQIDTLRHNIKIREEKVESVSKEKPEHIDEQMRLASDSLFGQMNDLTGGIASTRFEFNRFLAKVL